MNPPLPEPAALRERYRAVRRQTERLCEPLQTEDYGLQSMPDCSPPKWHLAHSTWFFETFVLAEFERGHRPHHPQFGFLFNSYYDAVGERWPRSARGLLSRPTVAEIFAYRQSVDGRMLDLLENSDDPRWAEIIELGLNHEQQHQELLLTDLKHAFGQNPLRPAYFTEKHPQPTSEAAALTWRDRPSGVCEIGCSGTAFAFDNETPRHRVFLESFRMATRPSTCAEYLGFIDDGGYRRPELWLSDGWAACKKHDWRTPLYWEQGSDGWRVFTLRGLQALDPNAPVCHVSFYEADAFARWSDARLPTEGEWETSAGERSGEVWEWTASPYVAYPGYRPAPGAVGEYDGKFMCNQFVLRGGSFATPAGHVRPTYRNFFPPEARWQFSGVRLARDLS